jgi:uncharacterized Zn ribbon protein
MPDEPDHDGHICERCESEYSLRDGQDPTRYCDECAQVVVEEQAAQIERLRTAISQYADEANWEFHQEQLANGSDIIAYYWDHPTITLPTRIAKEVLR